MYGDREPRSDANQATATTSDAAKAQDAFASSGPSQRADLPMPTTTKLNLNMELVEVPTKLLESVRRAAVIFGCNLQLFQEDVLRSVLKHGYSTLSDAKKEQLKVTTDDLLDDNAKIFQRYLPDNFTDADVESTAFTSDIDFCFGNPVSHVYERMQGSIASSQWKLHCFRLSFFLQNIGMLLSCRTRMRTSL
jgi:hypothetical protein